MDLNKKFILGGAILVVVFLVLGAYELSKIPRDDNTGEEPIVEKPTEEEEPKETVKVNNYDYRIIKEVNNNYNENYMISPLSIAYALTILNEGAKNNTKSQISQLLNNYKLDRAYSIKDRVSIANTLFIREEYKKYISSDYISRVQNSYGSDLLFDEFKTPKVINDWISEKTFKMLNNVVDNISKDFVLGIANAIAIDVEWNNKFECTSTREEEFTLIDNKTMKTPMMSSSNDVSYIESEKAKGIIKDYKVYDKTTGNEAKEGDKNTISLEYIAILPNDNIKDYIDNFDNKEFSTLLSSKKQANEKLDINYKIPRYTYDFSYNKFSNSLKTLGLTDMFISDKADFDGMINRNAPLHLYVTKSIHKTHIEFNENGTKAAAVTVFMLDRETAMPIEKETINIEFNKPFLYIIREKNSNKIWFFGTVYKPDKWDKNSTKNCTIK